MSKMKSSKNDIFIYKIWTRLLIIYLVMFICSAVVPIVAMFPGLGFPCYFNNLVNYSSMDLRAKNVARHLTPTLFLEAPEMFFYITVSFLADCCCLLYYFLAAVAICRAKKHVDGLNVLSQWIFASGSPTLIFMSILKLWTIQLFIHTLSYKHIYLAAFIYTVHWLLSVLYTEFYITGISTTWTNAELKRSIPKGNLLQTVVNTLKPIMMNIHLTMLAMETLVFCLSFMMAIGNSFYVVVSDIVFGTVNLYLIIPLIWYFATEVWLYQYMNYQFGFYIGTVISSIILILPLVRYEKIFVAAQIHKTVAINIAVIPILAFAAFILRMTRAILSRRHVAYSALPSTTYDTVKFTKSPKQLPKRTLKQNALSSAILEDESDEMEFE
ncbi:glycoprotein M [Porcine lymphotropic herpesvirus 3]|uniref:Glycoprotein M n=1 Tax=Suid gammaherpesvirus 5 TaxID=1960251 RepID=Q8B3Y3_9GAMA|nr:glycoprotein M [Porcine lymphotropic herpesvirus 3]AAO12342.1 glycoprotein M [Porcine lymphotropic herpesvirus 3]